MLEKVDIFQRKRDVYFFILAFSFIFSISLFFKYLDFTSLQNPNKFRVKVITQHIKISNYGEEYTVLKLGYKSSHFYTTSYLDLPQNIDSIKIKSDFSKINFFQYLQGFFIKTDINIPSIVFKKKNLVESFILKQHKNEFSQELFLALFLAKPLSATTRDKISNFGVAHLVAISGFHLGFLGGILFAIFSFLYKFVAKAFPFRNKFIDISLLVFTVLFLYMYFIDFPPSLIRAYSMMIVIFLLYINHFNVFSFEVLFVASSLAIAIFPTLLFSLSFWFSVWGVFIIYLYLKFIKKANPLVYLIGLNIWVFLLMQPISHTFFDKFTFFQLLSPLFSISFVLFYPFEILLHLFGYGGVLDKYIEKLFSIQMSEYHFMLDNFYFIGYLILLLFFSKIKL